MFRKLQTDDQSEFNPDPDASPCNYGAEHVMTPWTYLSEAEGDEGQPLAIQYAECVRCGFVSAHAIVGDPDTIRSLLSRAVAVQREATRQPALESSPDDRQE